MTARRRRKTASQLPGNVLPIGAIDADDVAVQDRRCCRCSHGGKKSRKQCDGAGRVDGIGETLSVRGEDSG